MDVMYIYVYSGEGRDKQGAVWADGQGAAGGDERVQEARVGVGARRQEDSLTQCPICTYLDCQMPAQVVILSVKYSCPQC